MKWKGFLGRYDYGLKTIFIYSPATHSQGLPNLFFWQSFTVLKQPSLNAKNPLFL
jgi:hypothetical protein